MESYPSGFLKDLREINKYTIDPYSWIMGQFMRYSLVLENKTSELVETKIKSLNIQKPYVGYK